MQKYFGEWDIPNVNAGIFVNLSEEENIWLEVQHNKQQHLTLQMGAKELASYLNIIQFMV